MLRFVSVIFRHGKRTPSAFEMRMLSNKEPLTDCFYPIGFAGLTNEGKQDMYELGTEIRKRYGSFLSDTYRPEHVEARSTDYHRTKMSLDLVLAGLYPPSEDQRWNRELNWQPIPTISLPRGQDVLLLPIAASPRYLDEIERVGSLPEVRERAQEFCPLARKLSELIGQPVTSLCDMWVLYNGLMGLKSSNHELPEWTVDALQDGRLLEATSLQYEIYNYNDAMKKLNGGMLLKKIIDDMKTAIITGVVANARKINLFSCHDINIIGLLSTLGPFEPQLPEYSSAIILELIQRDDTFYVKIIRNKGIPVEFKEQQIWDYGTLCPFDHFVDLTRKVTPSDEEIDGTRERTVEFSDFADKVRSAKLTWHPNSNDYANPRRAFS